MTHAGRFITLGFSLALVAGAIGIADVFIETILFEAELTVNIPRLKPCDGDVLICGTAHLSPYGEAGYTLTVDSLEPQPLTCVAPGGTTTGAAYTAIATFTLADGSTLALSEEGLVCGPGRSLSAPASWRTYGNPVDGSGRWSVRSATGQFSGLTGAGTDAFHTSGADFRITYLGTLTR